VQVKIAGAKIEQPLPGQFMAEKHLSRGYVFEKLAPREKHGKEVAIKQKRRKKNQEGELQIALLNRTYSRHPRLL
jgi:hypothetical protein